MENVLRALDDDTHAPVLINPSVIRDTFSPSGFPARHWAVLFVVFSPQQSQIAHAGKYYKVNARLYDPPSQPVPLLMAGNGPKAMYRCGKYADGLITDPKTWKEHKTEFQKGASEAGKDLRRMPVFIEQYVVVGGDKEKAEAAEMWRFGPKAWNPYFNIRDPKTIEDRAQAEIPLEKVVEGWPVTTDPEAHVRVLSDLFDSGATGVHIHSGQHDQKRVIDFYGKEVLPRLRKTARMAA